MCEVLAQTPSIGEETKGGSLRTLCPEVCVFGRGLPGLKGLRLSCHWVWGLNTGSVLSDWVTLVRVRFSLHKVGAPVALRGQPTESPVLRRCWDPLFRVTVPSRAPGRVSGRSTSPGGPQGVRDVYEGPLATGPARLLRWTDVWTGLHPRTMRKRVLKASLVKKGVIK